MRCKRLAIIRSILALAVVTCIIISFTLLQNETTQQSNINYNIIGNNQQSSIKLSIQNITTKDNLETININLHHTNKSVSAANHPSVEAAVALPIIVVGLPKCGTTSIRSFFDSAGYTTSHWSCPKRILEPKSERNLKCGTCIQDAIQQQLPPLKSCGNYQVFAQIDVATNNFCHFPQVHNLQELYNEHPTATWILNTRNVTNWVQSITRWSAFGVPYSVRMAKCGPKSSNNYDLRDWYLQHVNNVRKFVATHTSLTFVEIDIEDSESRYIMSNIFQINAEYWQQQNIVTNEKKQKWQRKQAEIQKQG